MNQSEKRSFQISELSEHIAVVRMEPRSEVPSWAWTGSLSAVIRTSEEITIVCDQAVVPGHFKSERDWIALKVEGPLPFSMTGVLASLLDPLAAGAIPVFALSTFETDYILIKADKVERAKEILLRDGHKISVIVASQDTHR